MDSSPATPPRPLPPLFKLLGSAFALAHLLAVGLLALHARSGPWPTKWGNFEADGPTFAERITSQATYPYYLWHLRMTHNYHFQSNNVSGIPAIYFEVELKNDLGEVTKKLKFPDDKANFWVRQRQSILAQGLGGDQPLARRGTEVIAAPGQKLGTVEYWDESGGRGIMRLKVVPENLKPQEAVRPSETSKILAQSYLRHLCRLHNAKSAELIRNSREAVTPMVLIIPTGVPEDTFLTLKSHFGEYHREK